MDAATKDDLAKVKLDLIERIDSTRLELIERIDSTRLELIERIDSTRLELVERIERSETTLLREFRKWAVPHNARFKVFEVNVHGLAERVELLEERLTELEQK